MSQHAEFVSNMSYSKSSIKSRSLRSLVPWRRMARAFYWGLTGALVTLFLFGIGLISSQYTLESYCQIECSLHSWLSPVSPLSRIYVEHIMNHVIEPAQLEPSHPLTKEEVATSFLQDGLRGSFNRFLMGLIGNIVNGIFVEVGSGDGEYQSFTSQLEVLLGWQGLLIEPREDAYRRARERRRAAGANVCVVTSDFHSKELMWTPATDEDMPPLLQKAAQSRTVLKSYVPKEDLPDGFEWPKQCYRLEALIEAYRRSVNITDKPIDLLLLDSNAGELEMIDQLVKPIYRVVAISIPERSHIAWAMSLTAALRLRMVHPVTINFGFGLFVHNDTEIESDER